MCLGAKHTSGTYVLSPQKTAYNAISTVLSTTAEYGTHGSGNLRISERSRAISRHVVEVAGLPTRALKRLMDNARVVLAQSLAEGFGLLVAEATAAQVPVIATDIAPASAGAYPHEPLDGQGWLEAIRAMAAAPRQAVAVSTSSEAGIITLSAKKWERRETPHQTATAIDLFGFGQILLNSTETEAPPHGRWFPLSMPDTHFYRPRPARDLK
jgi:hypothetical protein